MVRHSLNFIGWKQRKEVAADLRRVYTAATEAEAETRLAEFAEKWDDKFPMIAKSWRANWARAIPFFAPPKEIRKVIYTGLRHRVGCESSGTFFKRVIDIFNCSYINVI
jgi:putative transposase